MIASRDSSALSAGGIRIVATLGLFGLAAFLIHSPHTLFDSTDRNWDFDAHYGWALQFGRALLGGDPYPRWMPLGNHGLGEPTLLFYSPLFYYATSLASLVTGSTWAAMKLVEVLSTSIVGVFSWMLLRRFVRNRIALLGALLCQSAPMAFMLFHYFNGFPWGTSFAAFTALTYFALPSHEAHSLLRPSVSLSVAILIATHVVSAVMGLICLTFLLLSEIRRDSSGSWKIPWHPLGSWFLSVGVGLGLSMFYLYPAVTSMDLTASSNWVDSYPPHDAFAFPTLTAILFGMRWFTFQWVVPSVSFLTVLFATYYYRSSRAHLPLDRRRVLLGLVAVSWASLFFASELSFPLWLFPPLELVQSPHRFLYVTALTGTLALMLCLGDSAEREPPAWLRAAGRTLPVLAFGLYLALNVRISLAGEPLHLERDRLEPYGSYGEYRVVGQREGAKDYSKRGGFQEECRSVGANCREVPVPGTGREWTTDVTENVKLRLPVLSFPAWELRLDGAPLEPSVDASTGLMAVELPPGHHTLSLHWERLPQEILGLWMSLLSLAVLVVAGAVRALSGRDPSVER